MILNDLVYIGNNIIAITNKNTLYIYNYLSDENCSFVLQGFGDKNYLNLLNNYYLLILSQDQICYYNIINKHLFDKKIFIDYVLKFCFFKGKKITPTIFKQINSEYTLIGDKEGNIIKVQFEKDFIEQEEFIIIDSCQIFKFIGLPIKNILFINKNKLLFQSEINELNIFLK